MRREKLIETYPELVKEWHPTKNEILTLQSITVGSKKKAWWRCSKGHEWEASILHRKNGRGCPYCKGKRPIIGETDLASVYPVLAKEWHPTKNGDLTPQSVTSGSNKKVWWQCEKNHEWQSTINNRTSNKNNCPYCSGRYPVIGENDLATTSPSLSKQWHPSKNGDLTPQSVTSGSNKKVWWQCEKGHEWQAIISSRKTGCGCPVCNTFGTSYPEQCLFFYLRKVFKNCQNRHRLIVGDDILEVDIFIPEIGLVLEYDGEYWHRTKSKRDFEKSKLIKKQYSLIRIREEGLPTIEGDYCIFTKGTESDIQFALNHLFEFIIENFALDVSIIKSIKTIEINPKKDSVEIFEKYYSQEHESSLVFTHPELAKEWHPTKNGNLKPENFKRGSDKKVWWKCSKGHEWEAIISSRSIGRGCPYCKGKRPIIGETDLATTHPELAKEWCSSKNGKLTPQSITFKSRKKVWWLCEQGHEWEGLVRSRSLKKITCPYCNGRKAIVGKSDLETLKSKLTKEWHPDKNESLTIQDISLNSHAKVWWKCRYGHEWEATVYSRKKGSGCPYCIGRRPIMGETDLATTHPQLAKEWHPDKNFELTPRDIVAGSGKKVWWQCEKGHEWETTVVHRSRGSNCPYCSGRRPIIGETDLVTTHPQLAKEWHPDKNGDLKPEQFKRGSNKKIWWQCEKGHEWEDYIFNRSRFHKNGCPYCHKIELSTTKVRRFKKH